MIDKETTGLVDRRSAVVARYSHRVGDDEIADTMVETLIFGWVKGGIYGVSLGKNTK